MLFPVLLAMQDTMGAMYCVVVSSLGLLSGPFCDAGSENYTYPFRNNTLEGNYLLNQPTWATCREPEHIVLWNVVLLSILLGIGAVEAVLCLSQLASGLCDIFCGTCIRKGQSRLSPSKLEFSSAQQGRHVLLGFCPLHHSPENTSGQQAGPSSGTPYCCHPGAAGRRERGFGPRAKYNRSPSSKPPHPSPTFQDPQRMLEMADSTCIHCFFLYMHTNDKV
ncbi:uncharacterized protein LOC131486549 [Neofelis nebulosa]|uniref:uncharacterized protein LOC131486549 n=1 Tax=Neofelis nebulosa TaxID=61452 RepID=UPI00272AE03F|nr:uncharacterized protein LOC131486549 [Neofelis nebulosa]